MPSIKPVFPRTWVPGSSPLRAQVYPQSIGTGQAPQHHIAHHGVQRHSLHRQRNAALGRPRQGQQLVYRAAGALLCLGNALQLAAPDGRIILRQRMRGLGANACQRRAQLMRHIASKLALGVQTLAHTGQQPVQRLAQALHIQGGGLLGERWGQRLQVGRIPLLHGILQSSQGAQVLFDTAQQARAQHHQQPQLGQARVDEQAVQQLGAALGGLGHDHGEGRRASHVQAHTAPLASLALHR